MTSIHVAVPVYNNAAGLEKLLPQILSQNFASITVLDDGSTDNCAEVVGRFDDVNYVRSDKNCGPVAAKNLILRQPPAGGYILFIDSDMDLVTQDIPELLNEFLSAHPKTGAGAGKIIDESGRIHTWNRGYDLNPIRRLFEIIFYYPTLIFRRIPYIGTAFVKIYSIFDTRLMPERVHKTDWVIEGFMFVKTELFLKHGGFDPRFKRNHEGPDLCLWLRQNGFQVWFFPKIVARHNDQSAGTNVYRAYHLWRSFVIYFWKNPSRLIIYYFPRP